MAGLSTGRRCHSRRSAMKSRLTALPADTVVWLDFRKRTYYAKAQKRYGRGLDGSLYVVARLATAVTGARCLEFVD